MVASTRFVTSEEFYAFINEPENFNKDFERIGGEIIEVVSDASSSEYAINIAFYIKLHIKENQIAGRVTGADGGYLVSGEQYIPDVAFISRERQAEPELIEGYNILAPDLAVEVLSPGNTETKMSIKIGNYLAANTLVWVVDPKTRSISVFVPGTPVKTLDIEGIIDGAPVFSGFRLPVRAVFDDNV